MNKLYAVIWCNWCQTRQTCLKIGFRRIQPILKLWFRVFFRPYGFIDSAIKRCLKILTCQDYCSISVETGYDNTECEKSKINQNQPGNHLLRVPRPLKSMNTTPFPLRNRRTCLKNFFRHSGKHKNKIFSIKGITFRSLL